MPSLRHREKVTVPVVWLVFSRLPRSLRSWVLTYFLSGQISRYAPMDTNCFSLSVSVRSTEAPLMYSVPPSTQIRQSLAARPLGLSSAATALRLSRTDNVGYPPPCRFSIRAKAPSGVRGRAS